METQAATMDPATPQPWPSKEAEQRRAMARQELYSHGHAPTRSRLVRDNCTACVHGEARAKGKIPNVAGWARVWVQGGWRIPPARLARELARTDNLPYVEALKRDIATFGVR